MSVQLRRKMRKIEKDIFHLPWHALIYIIEANTTYFMKIIYYVY